MNIKQTLLVILAGVLYLHFFAAPAPADQLYCQGNDTTCRQCDDWGRNCRWVDVKIRPSCGQDPWQRGCSDYRRSCENNPWQNGCEVILQACQNNPHKRGCDVYRREWEEQQYNWDNNNRPNTDGVCLTEDGNGLCFKKGNKVCISIEGVVVCP